MKKLIIIVLISLLSVVVVAANGNDDQGQPNDPDNNERANACYEGGSMEDANCSTEWEWVCGWHLIRWETDGSYDLPATCAILLPPAPVSETTTVTISCTRPDFFYSSDELEDTPSVLTIGSTSFTDACGNPITGTVQIISNVYEQSPGIYVCDTGGLTYEVRVVWSGPTGHTEYYTGNCLL